MTTTCWEPLADNGRIWGCQRHVRYGERIQNWSWSISEQYTGQFVVCGALSPSDNKPFRELQNFYAESLEEAFDMVNRQMVLAQLRFTRDCEVRLEKGMPIRV